MPNWLPAKSYGFTPGGPLTQVLPQTVFNAMDPNSDRAATKFANPFEPFVGPHQIAPDPKWIEELMAKDQANFWANQKPGDELYVNGKRVTKPTIPQVTIPQTIAQPNPGSVLAPTGGVQMPNLNQTTPNTSQDMWDSYSRINAANNGVLTKPPTTGWS